jgi:hypothetical protein
MSSPATGMRFRAAAHARRGGRLERLLARIDRRSRVLATVRLLAAALVVAALILAAKLPAERAAFQAAAAGGAIAFLVGLVLHRRPRQQAALLRRLVAVVSREEQRARGAWRTLPRDGRGLGEGFPFAADLSLFGHASLFQLVSRCSTAFGETALARAMTRGVVNSDVPERQQAVRELARLRTFRERLEAEGARASAEGTGPADIAAFLGGESIHDGRPWILPAALALVGLTAAAFAWQLAFGGPAVGLGLLGVQVVVFAATARRVLGEYEALLHHEQALEAWSAMLRAVERRRFRSPLLRRLHDAIRAGGAPASRAIARLGAITGSLSLRHGSLHPIVNSLVLWDLVHAARLARWRRDVGPLVATWFEALGEIEALGSLGGHLAGVDVAAMPRVAPDGRAWAALGLVHPLLPPETAVANDVALDAAGRLMLLTGSNMSGKSTLLRAIGVNTVLAMAGGAVAASSLELRPCRLLASIHVTDSLEEGVSVFHAEVRRMSEILDAVAAAERDPAAPPALYLIDEILRGTNTRERLVASRSVIRRLGASRSFGVVTSHDLSLVELERSVPTLRNAHFREEIRDGRMTFDYRLRPGPVTTTNALAVLRAHGIEVDEDA